MNRSTAKPLNPVSFLQTFITQSIKVAEQRCGGEDGTLNYIEHVGLATSDCLEETARSCLGYTGPINAAQYADLIIDLKNRIGGNFSRTSSPPDCVEVVNSRCPFGDMVKEAPELCRMTSSVFGGIAARNFGYGKVELKRRIALNDSHCEVCVYLDPRVAEGKAGDEYHCEGDNIVSRSSSAEVRARVEAKLNRVWDVANSDKSGATRPRPRPTVVAESPAMRSALEAVEVVAPTRATVLVTGETGVGKEVIARAIHALSERARRDLIAVNCGAIPETLIESALFGHEKGAFTDAYNVHHGFFERADGGTLFLDEIDCLPLSAQARLLRVLQEGDFERVGGRQTLSTDVRIIAASNQDLEQLVIDGSFRRDLFYRINVVPLHIPPLRTRADDLAPLVHHFLRRLAEKYRHSPRVLGQPAWHKVVNYTWPGNLRELENVLERAFLFARGSVIDDVELPAVAPAPDDTPAAACSLKTLRRQAVRQAEAEALVEALRSFEGNVTAVARRMSVTPRAVHMRLKRLGIDPAAFRISQRSSRR